MGELGKSGGVSGASLDGSSRHQPPISVTQGHPTHASPWRGDTEGGKYVNMYVCVCWGMAKD